LWRVVMLPPPAAESATGGVLCAVFDHLICDGVSLEQFAAGVASPTLPLVGSAGTYNAWLRWQLRTFTDAPNADSAFWRSHLDGTPANMPTPFPAPSVVTPGTYHVAEVASPVTASELRQACVRLRTTPLPLILGATASAISRLAAAEAVTLHVVLAARPALYARVFGFLANTVPIRLSTPRLPDLAYAFARARAVWPDIIDHQFAPYEYVKRMCGSVTTPAAGNVRVQVNYLPASIPSLPVSTSGDERLPRSSTLAITVEHVRDGRHVFHARCHSHTLEPDLVAACVEAIAQGWLELVRGP
jgi:hypothetical protein